MSLFFILTEGLFCMLFYWYNLHGNIETFASQKQEFIFCFLHMALVF